MLRSTLLACFALSTTLQAQTAWPDQIVCPPDIAAALQPLAGNGFGSSIEIVGDRMLVGAPEDQSNSFARGSAYVYERVTSEDPWVLMAKLYPSTPLGPVNVTDYGRSVASSGALIAIGSPISAPQGASYTGFVELWLRAPFGWFIPLGQISQPEPVQQSSPASLLGYAIEFDVSRLLISAPGGLNPAVYEYQIGASGGW